MKTAVVTGTSHGLGKDIALSLLESGWQVFGLARSDSDIVHVNYQHLNVDITDHATVAGTILQVGQIDLLVNNAAVFEMSSFEDSEIESINKIIDTNVKGTMYVTKSCLPVMNADSKIIFINSVAGLGELENQSIYCASKYALTAFAGVLGKELRSRKIKVVSIHPGGINTSLWNKSNPYPMGNVGDAIDPKQISALILFILSNSNIEFKTVKLFSDVEWH
jgi:NADP-dependent 3-hydroxy acid dehydrogenase YdfG